MPELPEYMKKGEKQPDQVFSPDERLFRRVPPDFWDDGGINVDAIEFPDMSVTREKYGPPSAARWDRGNLVDWGVIEFDVKDIPSRIPFQGAVVYSMKPVHVPLKNNYPHSEVQIFESKWGQTDVSVRLEKKTMPGVPREARQEWRELLRRKCRISLRPGEQENL